MDIDKLDQIQKKFNVKISLSSGDDRWQAEVKQRGTSLSEPLSGATLAEVIGKLESFLEALMVVRDAGVVEGGMKIKVKPLRQYASMLEIKDNLRHWRFYFYYDKLAAFMDVLNEPDTIYRTKEPLGKTIERGLEYIFRDFEDVKIERISTEELLKKYKEIGGEVD